MHSYPRIRLIRKLLRDYAKQCQSSQQHARWWTFTVALVLLRVRDGQAQMYTCYPALWGLAELNTGWIDFLSDFKFYSYGQRWLKIMRPCGCNHFLPGFTRVAPHTLPVSSFLPLAFPSLTGSGAGSPVNPADSMLSFAAGRCALFRNLDFKLQINRHLCNLPISTNIYHLPSFGDEDWHEPSPGTINWRCLCSFLLLFKLLLHLVIFHDFCSFDPPARKPSRG